MQLTWNLPQIAITKAIFHSLPEYSATVFFGGTRNDGTTMPAREWMTEAIALIDFEAEFKKAYQESQSIDEAFKVVAQILYDKMRELIKDPVWDYDRVTHRRSGQVVGSPRDIYDLGNLYEQQELSFE